MEKSGPHITILSSKPWNYPLNEPHTGYTKSWPVIFSNHDFVMKTVNSLSAKSFLKWKPAVFPFLFTVPWKNSIKDNNSFKQTMDTLKQSLDIIFRSAFLGYNLTIMTVRFCLRLSRDTLTQCLQNKPHCVNQPTTYILMTDVCM